MPASSATARDWSPARLVLDVDAPAYGSLAVLGVPAGTVEIAVR